MYSLRLSLRTLRLPVAASVVAPRTIVYQGSWSTIPLSRASYSTASSDMETGDPPLVLALKARLKTAMRAKDTQRLSVLRATLAAFLNLSKTKTPIQTDAQLVGLMRKHQRSLLETADEFRRAGRPELAEKEEAQARIYEELVADSGVATVEGAALKTAVEHALVKVKAEEGQNSAGKALTGLVMRTLTHELAGKDVDRKELADIVRKVLEADS